MENPAVRWVFILKTPTVHVVPPESALTDAKLRVVDFLRTWSGNPRPIGTEGIIAGTAARFHLPESDLAWAVYYLAKERLLEVKPPADWSPHSNPHGCEMRHGQLPDGTFGQVNTVQLPFEKATIAPTEDLWSWRRDNDSPSARPAPPAGSAGEEATAAENILARARAVRQQQDEEVRRRQEDAERRQQCEQASKEYGSKITALFEAHDPFQRPEPFDPTGFLHDIFVALSNACQVFRSNGLNEAWRRVDREATFNHYRSGFHRPDEAKVAFDWGCHFLDLGLKDSLQERDIEIAWENPSLRGSYHMAEILLLGMSGLQRIHFQKGTTGPMATSDAVVAAGSPTAPRTGKNTSRMRIDEIRGKVDVGIITIREDEFAAVLERLKNRSTVQGGRQYYEFARVETRIGGELGVAVVRCLEQGQGEAQSVAWEVIDDLNPVAFPRRDRRRHTES
jgi:hypothetical protein